MGRTTRGRLRGLRDLFTRRALALAAVGAVGLLPCDAAAQTITGTLLDLETEQPVELGLVVMYTEAGDSVGMTVTDERGRFSLRSPEPGSFILLASALGYDETPAGVFELGEGGVMDVEYRIAPAPLALDELLVSLDRPVLRHRLVQNGFVRRFQRGLGAFVTPHDIEESPATSTEDLLTNIPGVRVGDVRVSRGEMVIQRPDIGQTLQLRGPGGGWCAPTVYVDGARAFYQPDQTTSSVTLTLSTLAPLATVDAIEVYRRPAEVPVEYSPGSGQGGLGTCGVVVVWTKSATPGVLTASGSGDEADESEPAPLPSVDRRGPPPTPGETIRMEVDVEARERLGLTSPWQGTFLMVHEDQLVANNSPVGRAVAVPLREVEALQVRRDRDMEYAFLRGAVAGTGFALGMWQFLEILCRSACEGGLGSAWFPAIVTGVGVGALVGSQGPGQHWVEAGLPEPDPPADRTEGTDPSPPPPPPGGSGGGG